LSRCVRVYLLSAAGRTHAASFRMPNYKIGKRCGASTSPPAPPKVARRRRSSPDAEHFRLIRLLADCCDVRLDADAPSHGLFPSIHTNIHFFLLDQDFFQKNYQRLKILMICTEDFVVLQVMCLHSVILFLPMPIAQKVTSTYKIIILRLGQF
jgi:hypothetical protein